MMQKLLFIHALSPLHAGTGQSTGAIDLPIARDKATGIPLLPGSSLKGSLRAEAKLKGVSDDEVKKLFGPETSDENSNAGDLVFGDANLICLPVRSVAGTFAYVTSPWILTKLKRDLVECNVQGANGLAIPEVPTEECIVCGGFLKVSEKVIFEDLDLSPAGNANDWASMLAGSLFENADDIETFKKRFCIVSDDVMSFFCQHAMDVRTRVSIDHVTGTAKGGQLWTEESLPTESILCSMVMGRKTRDDAFENLISNVAPHSIQLGGKATVGRGRCRLIVK